MGLNATSIVLICDSAALILFMVGFFYGTKLRRPVNREAIPYLIGWGVIFFALAAVIIIADAPDSPIGYMTAGLVLVLSAFLAGFGIGNGVFPYLPS
jgi:uncharacterized membrane protein